MKALYEQKYPQLKVFPGFLERFGSIFPLVSVLCLKPIKSPHFEFTLSDQSTFTVEANDPTAFINAMKTAFNMQAGAYGSLGTDRADEISVEDFGTPVEQDYSGPAGTIRNIDAEHNSPKIIDLSSVAGIVIDVIQFNPNRGVYVCGHIDEGSILQGNTVTIHTQDGQAIPSVITEIQQDGRVVQSAKARDYVYILLRGIHEADITEGDIVSIS
jgi:hypothetical protein